MLLDLLVGLVADLRLLLQELAALLPDLHLQVGLDRRELLLLGRVVGRAGLERLELLGQRLDLLLLLPHVGFKAVDLRLDLLELGFQARVGFSNTSPEINDGHRRAAGAGGRLGTSRRWSSRQMAKAAATIVARERNVVTFSTPCVYSWSRGTGDATSVKRRSGSTAGNRPDGSYMRGVFCREPATG